MKKTVSVIWGIACILISGTCEAASFDCRNAKTDVEKLICSDPKLSILDEEMSASYTDVFNSSKKNIAIKRGQRRWLKSFRNQCNDIDCLTREYKIRIAELTLLGKSHHRTEKPRLYPPEDSQLVAEYANRKILRALEAPSKKYELPDNLKKKFAQVATEKNDITFDIRAGMKEYWSADFNQDGLNDHLLINHRGTARVQYAYLISGKDDTKITVLNHDEGERTYGSISFIKIGQQYYCISLGGAEYKLRRLWKIDEFCNFSYVCRYSQAEKLMIELVSGKSNTICLSADAGKIKHAKYTSKHSISKLPYEDRFWSKYIREGMASVDIDNDGQMENVVPIDYDSSAGRGWTAEYIATTDATCTTVPDTPLNHLLLEDIGGMTGPDMSFFTYDSATYLDARSKRGYRKIYKISCNATPPSLSPKDTEKNRNCHAETICEFQDRIINYVVLRK